MRSESAPGSLLLAAAVLDGVPENVALGTTLAAGGGSVALLGAIFVSNFPEALVGARSMCDSGRSVKFALGTWYVAAVVLALAIIAGGSLLDVAAATLAAKETLGAIVSGRGTRMRRRYCALSRM